jgi:hypothetical protein
LRYLVRVVAARSRFPLDQVVKIVMILACLIAILTLRTTCSENVARFVTGFDQQPPDGGKKPAPADAGPSK